MNDPGPDAWSDVSLKTDYFELNWYYWNAASPNCAWPGFIRKRRSFYYPVIKVQLTDNGEGSPCKAVSIGWTLEFCLLETIQTSAAKLRTFKLIIYFHMTILAISCNNCMHCVSFAVVMVSFSTGTVRDLQQSLFPVVF